MRPHPPRLVSVVSPLALRLEAAAPVARVLGAGLPLLCRMPDAAAAWWPVATAPWRICQEGAAVVAAAAGRRVLRATTRDAARALLCRRRTPRADLCALAGGSGLSGLELCDAEGAAVLTLPPLAAVAAVAAGGEHGGHEEARTAGHRDAEPRAIAALVEADGALLLLAFDDLLERFASLYAGTAAAGP